MSLPVAPFGPNSPADHLGLLSRVSWPLPLGSADVDLSQVFTAGIARRIYINTSGTLYISRVGDGGVYTPYQVVAGTFLDGEFALIGGTVTGSSAMTVVVEL
jgi:hypothetical protein